MQNGLSTANGIKYIGFTWAKCSASLVSMCVISVADSAIWFIASRCKAVIHGHHFILQQFVKPSWWFGTGLEPMVSFEKIQSSKLGCIG